MYRIGICDDDVTFREELEKKVQDVFRERGVEISIRKWKSFEEAKQALEKNQKVELLFLDIELETEKGTDLARYIRRQLDDDQVEIVYVSYEQGYAMELFDTEPLGFLIKPVATEELVDVCNRFLRKRKVSEQFYYKEGLDTKVIQFREVMYFQSRAHKISANFEQETREFYGKLEELQGKMPEYFIRIHKSYLVNTCFIQRYCPDKVILCNGEKLTISRTYKNQVRAYVSKRLEEI